jgi:hypothetical protein
VVIPEDVNRLDSRLGKWLKENLQKRRNTIRFLLPRNGSGNAYTDRDLVVYARAVLKAQEWRAQSPYLLLRRGNEASAEFQKVLDQRGVVQNEAIGALAHLQLARAYALQGDTAKARTAYQDFLALWKDADPDIPVLIAAKSEYAKLK